MAKQKMLQTLAQLAPEKECPICVLTRLLTVAAASLAAPADDTMPFFDCNPSEMPPGIDVFG
jgi:hypothetical protein